jgi:Uma2 family endonuclease
MTTLVPIDLEVLPGKLVLHRPISDAALEQLCQSSDFIQFERTKDGEIRMNVPAGGFTSDGNAEIIGQLRKWWKTHRRGRTFDSNGGFYLPDGSMLSPDAAYVTPERLKGMKRTDLSGFPRVCPDFVIELFSGSDSLREAKAKMAVWMENGAALAWLVNPYRREVLVYSRRERPRTVTGRTVEGTGPVAGFTLDLDEVWSCYEI